MIDADAALQALGPKAVRRIGRAVGDATITRAWVDNAGDPQRVLWATWDHEHGWYDRRTGEVTHLPHGRGHVPSCYRFGGSDRLSDLLHDLDPFIDDGHWPVQGYDR